jgi:hypothetical protein
MAAGTATLQVGGNPLVPDRPFLLRWAVAFRRRTISQPRPCWRAGACRARSRNERWLASDVIIEGDDEVQLCRVPSRGARGLTGDAYFDHVF